MNLIFVIGKKLFKIDNIINFIIKVNSIMEELLKFKHIYGDKQVINGFGVNINPSIEIYIEVAKLRAWFQVERKK